MELFGRTLGNYRLIERVGQGGMAQVFRAEQQTIDRLVAVKILHSHLAQSPDFVSRFKREAKALGQLQHPHIVRVIDFAVEGDLYYMVMDYVPGLSLSEYLAERPPLPPDEALDLTIQLAEALAYAHKHGMIHRDLKPSNVLFRDYACTDAVLTDFGISRLLDDATLTMSGAIIGTPAYMSPEAILGAPVDRRADIYSLGIMLYEMLTGRAPYTGETPMSVLMKQAHDPPPPLQLQRPDTPAPLVRLVEKALAKQPEERFQTADELLAEAGRVRAALGGSGSQPKPTQVLEAVHLTDEPREQATAAGTAMDRAQPPPTGTASTPSAQGTPQALGTAPPAQARRGRPALAMLGALAIIAIAATMWLWYGQAARPDDPRPAPATAVVQATAAPTAASPTGAALSGVPGTAGTAVVIAAEPGTAPGQAAAATEVSTAPTPAAVATATPLPARASGSLGALRFAPGDGDEPGRFALTLDRVPLPPAGSHYQLWLQDSGGQWQSGGPLPVRGGAIVAQGSLGQPLIDPASRVVVSLESDGADDAQAAEPGGPPVYSGQLSDGHAAAMRRLLVDSAEGRGLVPGAGEQALLAAQHAQFSHDALDTGDLALAQRHIEHVINILDGAEGKHFGDLNGDGQAQNPGDGFGVHAYLEASADQIRQALAGSGLAASHQIFADEAQVIAADGLQLIGTALERGQEVFLCDTPAEARPLVEQVQAQVALLAGGPAGRGAIPAIQERALALGAIPLADEQGSAAAPDPIAGSEADAQGLPASGRVGALRLGSEGGKATILLQLERVEPPPGFHYDAWLTKGAGRPVLFLGKLEVIGQAAALSAEYAGDPLADFDRLVVSLEVDGDLDLVPATTLVYAGDLASAAGQELLQSAGSPLLGAEAQAAIAIQHRQFVQEALNAAGLAEAQRHAEHIINVLDGGDGQAFGDINLDGQIQNPGDSIGVRGYLARLIAATETWQGRSDLTGNQRFYAARIAATASNSLGSIDEAIEQAHKITAADTADEARGFVAALDQALSRLEQGVDLDGSGVVDPLLDEGGLEGLRALALATNEVNILAAQDT